MDRFPDVFRSHMDVRKAIQAEREHLLKTDADFKETLFANHCLACHGARSRTGRSVAVRRESV